MIYFPIFIPSGDGPDCIFPGWVEALFMIALVSTLAGMVAMLACFAADVVLDRPNPGNGKRKMEGKRKQSTQFTAVSADPGANTERNTAGTVAL